MQGVIGCCLGAQPQEAQQERAPGVALRGDDGSDQAVLELLRGRRKGRGKGGEGSRDRFQSRGRERQVQREEWANTGGRAERLKLGGAEEMKRKQAEKKEGQ